MAVQQIDRMAFGTGRLFATPAGGGQRLPYADLNDITIDVKVELKEIYGENGFALSVADGHKGIDITAKHYSLTLALLAQDFNAPAQTAGTYGTAIDEPHTVPGTPYSVTLTNGATFVAGSLYVQGFPLIAGVATPVDYQIVTAGSEVAGVSCSVTSLGVVTFAAGDTTILMKATYDWAQVTGKTVKVTNTYQNSAPFYQLDLVKRDRSPLDGSTGALLCRFYAVRFGGFKHNYKEGEYTNYERIFKAFADPSGNVFSTTFVNS